MGKWKGGRKWGGRKDRQKKREDGGKVRKGMKKGIKKENGLR